ncbi:MAG: CHAT domain-containing protein [Bacteroidia bacterium]
MSICLRFSVILIVSSLLGMSGAYGQIDLDDIVTKSLKNKNFEPVQRVIDSARNVNGVHDTILGQTFHWEGIMAVMKKNDHRRAYKLQLKADSLMKEVSELKKVKLWADLGTSAYRLKRYDIAGDFVNKAHDATTLHQFSPAAYQLRILLTKGSLLINEGDMEGGLADFLKAKAIFDKGGFDTEDYEGRIIGSIGFAYDRMALYKEAIPYHKESYKLNGSNSLISAQVLSIMASDYNRLKQYDSALFWVNKSLDILDRKGASSSRAKVSALRVKASIHNMTGSIDAAIRCVGDAISILEQTRGKYHRTIAQSYYDRAIYLMYAGLYQEANPQFQSALKAAGKPTPGSPWLTYLRFQTFHGTNQLHLAQQGDKRWLDSAEVSLNEANLWIDSLRHRNRGAKSDQILFQIARKTYETYIEVMLKRYKLDSNPAWLEKAFLFGEKGKAVRLMENRWANQATSFSGVPVTITKEEGELERNWEALTKAAHRYPDSSSIQSEMFLADKKRNQFFRELKADYPHYYQLKYASPEPAFSAIKPLLDHDTWLVSYYFMEKSIQVFALNADTVIQWNVPLSDSLEHNIARWKEQITDQKLAERASFAKRAASEYARLTAGLNNVLLGPVMERNPKNLCIVPDELLSGMPFGTLSLSPSQAEDFQDIPYLIKTLNISYLPAANALLMPRQQHDRNGRYIGFAPSYRGFYDNDQSRGARGPLLYNEEEVDFASKIIDGTAVLGEKASKKAFLQKAPGAGLIHLALHAFVDEEDPMQSALFFSESEELKPDALRAFEIYALSLQADLTILSACQSGDGPVTNAEGILSLGRAFQYAGCSNMLVTQWKMDDKASLKMMKSFFQQLDQKPVSHALKDAKLSYLEEEDLTHPYYWGGWILVGENKYIDIKRTNYPSFMPWVLTCIVFIISFLSIKKAKGVD